MKNKGLLCTILIAAMALTSCAQNTVETSNEELSDLKLEGSLVLSYAEQFSVDFYENDYTMIHVADEYDYLIVPEGEEVPDGISSDVIVIPQAPDDIYVSGSATMDFFREVGALDMVKMTSTDAPDWAIPEIASEIEAGNIFYIGKYSAPDYEALLELDCELAIENTMIFHSPEVKEKIEELGIPVFVDYSSYEENPLGRLEWIKLYGVLTGHLDEAEAFFAENVKNVEQVIADVETYEGQAPTIAFFYISANGYAVVRRPGDYLSKMIALAGGDYIIPEEAMREEDSTSATMNMQMETFYAYASEADIIIYNSTIDGEIYTIDELVSKDPLLGDFKAVETGNVFCTNSNMFQQTTGIGNMILDFNHVIVNPDCADSELNYLHRVTE